MGQDEKIPGQHEGAAPCQPETVRESAKLETEVGLSFTCWVCLYLSRFYVCVDAYLCHRLPSILIIITIYVCVCM